MKPDRELELSIVGAMLVGSSETRLSILENCGKEDFHFVDTRAAFIVCQEFTESDPVSDIDAVLVSRKLNTKSVDDCTEDAMQHVGLASSGIEYARELREQSRRQQLATALRTFGDRALNHAEDIDSIAEEAERAFLNMKGRGPGFVSIGEAAAEAMKRIAKRMDGDITEVGYEFPFADLKRILTPLADGDMVVVAGRPGAGKTTFALQTAYHCALTSKQPVLFFSLEMSAQILGKILISQIGRIPYSKVVSEGLSQDEYRSAGIATSILSDVPLLVHDTQGLKLSALKTMAFRFAMNEKPAMIVVDYAQIIRMSQPRGWTREQVVAEISHSLKILARQIGCPLVAVAQLNRGSVQTNEKPRLHHLRESDALAQDCDAALFLWREDQDTAGVIDINVDKQRRGPTGECQLSFLAKSMKFCSLASSADEGVPF